MKKRRSQELAAQAVPSVATANNDPRFLPASPEAEFRLSYQFIPLPASVTRITIGAGILAALLIYFQPW